MGQSYCSAIALIVSSMLGYGIITVSKGFSLFGYAGSIILLTILGIITFITLELLFKSLNKLYLTKLGHVVSTENEKIWTEPPQNDDFSTSLEKADVEISIQKGEEIKLSFSDMSLEVWKYMPFITDLFLLSCLFLTTIAYHGALVKLIEDVLRKYFDLNVYSKYYIAVGISVLQYMLGFIKNTKCLSKVAYISALSCLYVAVLCICYAFKKPEISTKPISFSEFQNSIGIFIFALCCNTSIPEIFNGFDKNKNTSIISAFGIIIGFILTLTVGIAGYFTGGNVIQNYDNILEYFESDNTPLSLVIENSNFDEKGFAIEIAVVAFILILNVAYVINFYVFRQCINGYIKKVNKSLSKRNKLEILIFSIFNLIYLATVASLTLFCDTSEILNWAGIICGNYFSFFLPALCYIRICKRESLFWFVMSIIILILSLISVSYFIIAKIFI
eukprot:143778_1